MSVHSLTKKSANEHTRIPAAIRKNSLDNHFPTRGAFWSANFAPFNHPVWIKRSEFNSRIRIRYDWHFELPYVFSLSTRRWSPTLVIVLFKTLIIIDTIIVWRLDQGNCYKAGSMVYNNLQYQTERFKPYPTQSVRSLIFLPVFMFVWLAYFENVQQVKRLLLSTNSLW